MGTARVLAFHNVTPGFSWGVTTLSPERFRATLSYLRHAISEKPINDDAESPLRLTFDDAYDSFIRHIDPALRSFDFGATIFAPTHYLGMVNKWDYSSRLRPARHLTAKQLRELSDAGYRVESHGHTHADLAGIDRRRLHDELYLSKKIIEDICGREVTEICYPFGRSNQTVEEVAKECGYLRGWSMRPSDDGPFTFGRWGIYSFDTPLTLSLKLQPGFWGEVERQKLAVVGRLSRGASLAFWVEKLGGKKHPS